MKIIPRIGLAISLLALGVLLGVLISSVGLLIFSGNNLVVSSCLFMLVGEILFLVPALSWIIGRKIDLVSAFRLNPVRLNSTLAIIPFGLGLIILLDELDRIIQMVFPLPPSFAILPEILRITDWLSGIMVIGLMVFIAPLIEEILVRGFFQRILEYRLKDATKAVCYSALVFAIIHFNPWWMIQILIVGFFLGYIAWRTNSVWISFVLHAMNNGIAVWLAHQPEESLGWYEFNGHVNPYILIFATLLTIFGLKYFINITPIKEKDIMVVLDEKKEIIEKSDSE